MYSHTGQEAGPSKMINQAELSYGPGPRDEEDISALMWDKKLKKGTENGGKGALP